MAAALIVEDGTRVAGANSYITLDFANTYHDTLGNLDWAGLDDATKTLNIIIATESMDLIYGGQYMSIMYETTIQGLLWPRYQFMDKNFRLRYPNEIPLELQKAVAMHALNIADGLADPYPDFNGNDKIKQTSTKIGDIVLSTLYKSPLDTVKFDGYRKLDLLLRPIIKGVRGTVMLTR